VAVVQQKQMDMMPGTRLVSGACPHDGPDACATVTEVRDGRAVAVRRMWEDDALPAQTETPLDAPTLETLYERHVRSIYRFVYSKVGNREEAEDLTSQVFLKAVRWIDSSRDALSAQGWLFQVARRTIADHWRSVYQFRANSLDDLLDAGLELPAAERASMDTSVADRRVERILALLPARYRDVLTHRFLLNCSIKETAAALGISAANVKVIQFRALKKASESDPNDPTADS
jgi:RNA polymerase sigma-70 factor (ECF subfamily)